MLCYWCAPKPKADQPVPFLPEIFGR